MFSSEWVEINAQPIGPGLHHPRRKMVHRFGRGCWFAGGDLQVERLDGVGYCIVSDLVEAASSATRPHVLAIPRRSWAVAGS